MTWFSVWFVLLTLAATLFALLGVRMFRQAKALAAEVSVASARLNAVSDAISRATTGPAWTPEGDQRARHRA